MRKVFYNDVRPSISQPPQILKSARHKAVVKEKGSTMDEPQASRQLDMIAIINHFNKHGAVGTFLVSPCKKSFPTGFKAEVVYVIPKRNLLRAFQQPEDMARMMKLVLAHSETEIREACCSPQGTYDFHLHM